MDQRRRRLPGVYVLADRIRAARLQQGLSLSKVVAGSTYTRAAAHLVETGKNRPSMDFLEHIAKTLNHEVEEFLVDPEHPYDPGSAVHMAEEPDEILERALFYLIRAQVTLRKVIAEYPDIEPAEVTVLNMVSSTIRHGTRFVRTLAEEYALQDQT